MEICRDVVGADYAFAKQAVGRLRRTVGVEIQRIVGQGGAGRQGLVQRGHAQQGLQGGHAFTQPQGLGPGAAFGVRAIGDQHLGAGRRHQRGELVFAQQRIQRLDDAGGFAAPQRQVVFQAAGQNHADGVARAHAKVMQQRTASSSGLAVRKKGSAVLSPKAAAELRKIS
ncbi:hypothetical protein G6F35_015029 [Rhizopus arrhizus]|nr:hypothetical protein G6F35_015029 [Rhizopus arrhizus]